MAKKKYSGNCHKCQKRPIVCRNMCNTCYARWWRENNRERYEEYHKIYEEERKNNPERKIKQKIASRKSYLRHRIEILKKSRDRYWNNKEERRNWENNWIQNNRDKKRAAWKKWNNRKRSNSEISIGLSSDEWEQIKKDWNYCCAYCGKLFNDLTQDHVIPLSKGGIDSIENIVPACKSCNSSKGNKDLKEWTH